MVVSFNRNYTEAWISKHTGLVSTLVTRCSLFIRNGEVLASLALVLATDEVRDLLVLGLLDGTLVVLRTLAEELLLDVVDAYSINRSAGCIAYSLHEIDTHPCQGRPRSSRPGLRRQRRC